MVRKGEEGKGKIEEKEEVKREPNFSDIKLNS